MAYQWQTIEQAAVTLGISTRTLARRIAQGKIENRLEDGRREVFICLPDEADDQGEYSADPSATDSQSDVSPPDVSPPDASSPDYGEDGAAVEAIAWTPVVSEGENGIHREQREDETESEAALIVAEDRARRAEMTLNIIQTSAQLMATEARRARVGARWAWGTVALLGAGVTLAVGWTTAHITHAQARVDLLQDRLERVSTDYHQTAQERDQLRVELSTTAQAQARLDGQLAEVRQEVAATAVELKQTQEKAQAALKAATTQPTSIVARLASIVLGDGN